MLRLIVILVQLAAVCLRWCGLAFRSTRSVEAENLFLRRQLALYIERGMKPRRMGPATRIALAWLSRWFDWRDALVVVRPETLIPHLREDWIVRARSILGGLHHEYFWAPAGAH